MQCVTLLSQRDQEQQIARARTIPRVAEVEAAETTRWRVPYISQAKLNTTGGTAINTIIRVAARRLRLAATLKSKKCPVATVRFERLAVAVPATSVLLAFASVCAAP